MVDGHVDKSAYPVGTAHSIKPAFQALIAESIGAGILGLISRLMVDGARPNEEAIARIEPRVSRAHGSSAPSTAG